MPDSTTFELVTTATAVVIHADGSTDKDES